jgi:predicted acylesterase/phospholipase RssA
MKQGRNQPRRQRRLWLLIAALSGATGCLRTSVLVQKFNEGAIDTGNGDPAHDPAALRQETASRRIEQELIDGYFGQSGEHERAVRWLARGARLIDASGRQWFSASVRRWLCSHGKTAKVNCAERGATKSHEAAGSEGSETAQAALTDRIVHVAPLPADAQSAVCRGGQRQDRAVEAFVDTIRYRLALRRAVEAGAALVDEGQIPLAELDGAAAAAFRQASTYLANRKWKRRLSQPTPGLVVKGGASTGIFSAGAVWVALNIDHQCSLDPDCRALQVSPRFSLMSGTSTGAMIATAADIYYASGCEAQLRDRLRLFEQWFVCSPAAGLYCTVKGHVLNLLAGQQISLLEFDGLRSILSAGLDPSTLANHSELLLNVVDFRTGRLYELSDQDQLHTPDEVGSAAIASAALPVIVRPEKHFRSVEHARGDYAYLDGGIRSELPLAAPIRRGAERLLIVSSAPSVMGEASQRDNGFDVLLRYIDVSTGGVLESEIDWAPRLAESRRLSEFTQCRLTYERSSAKLCPEGGCDPVALCSGRWSQVCSTKGESDAARGPDEAAPKQPASTDSLALAANAHDLLAPLWRTTAIYRDERRVPGLPGYLFRRADQRKLFLAGAEEARQRCFEIAGLLGLPATDPAWRQKLVRWCSPTLEPLDQLCLTPPSETLRSCSEPPPPPPAPTAKCP